MNDREYIALVSRLEALARVVVKHKKERRLKDLEDAWKLAEECLKWIRKDRDRSQGRMFE